LEGPATVLGHARGPDRIVIFMPHEAYEENRIAFDTDRYAKNECSAELIRADDETRDIAEGSPFGRAASCGRDEDENVERIADGSLVSGPLTLAGNAG
jgi:hypothetical protein